MPLPPPPRYPRIIPGRNEASPEDIDGGAEEDRRNQPRVLKVRYFACCAFCSWLTAVTWIGRQRVTFFFFYFLDIPLLIYRVLGMRFRHCR